MSMEKTTEMQGQSSELLTRLRESVESHIRESVESSISEVFQRRKEVWVESVTSVLRERVGEVSSSAGGEASQVTDAVWIEIASLSQLRKEVGGRFQNLRTRWLEAGFPLKAHRGDPSEDYNLDESGWLEMTSWLLKQGYESRLLDDLNKGYFEIRKPES